MARVAKKSNLSMEEKLEQALIPNWDEPYKLPKNWYWTKFGQCSRIRTGKKDANYGSKDGEYPFFTCAAEPIRCDNYSFDCAAMLLAGNGDIGNISIYNGKFEAYQRTYVVETIGEIDIQYVYYFFKYRWEDYNKDKMFGSAIPYIRLGNLQDFPFPLAPIQEQKRIVERIQSLFAKLDETKEKAQEVIDGYEMRKAAILHKAFSGELTAKWRKNNQIDSSSWRRCKLKDCGIWFGGGTPTTNQSEFWDDDGYLWITAKDMKADLILDTKLHITSKGVENSSAVYCDKPAVLFVMRSGILRRILPISMVSVPFTVNQDLKAVIPNEEILQKYLFWVSTCIEKEIRNSCMKNGTTVESIDSKRFFNFSIPIAKIQEQKEIVKVIEELINKENFAKETAEKVLEQIEQIKKSILSKAFRGELSTSAPTDHPALELLKEILENEKEEKPKKITQKKKTDIKILLQLNVRQVKIYELLLENGSLNIDEIAQEIGKNISYLFDDVLDMESKNIIVVKEDNRYYINANN